MPDLVVFSEKENIGRIELNRPKALNSLNLDMVKPLYDKLVEWESRDDISALILFSRNEKSFCAGGDVKRVVLELRESSDYPPEFFTYEYLVDELMSRYEKPIFCWGSGIVMGGGMGLFMAASHRIATETSIFAMPEIAIGFFPDVGASYFLNQLPKGIGHLLGLSGHRLTGEEAVQFGIANAFMNSSDLDKVITDIAGLQWTQSPEENKILADSFLEKTSPLSEPNKDILKSAERVFSVETLEEAIDLWSKEPHPFFKDSLDRLKEGSYHSAQITWEMLKRGKSWSRKEATWREWAMAQRFSDNKDFHEGVRAVLIDKDKNAKWSGSPLSQSEIDEYFKDIPENPVRNCLHS